MLLFDFQFYFRFLTIFHRVFTQNLAWGQVVIICILCIYIFCYRFWVLIFPSHWLQSPNVISSYAKWIFLYFMFLDPTQGYHYFWHGTGFQSQVVIPRTQKMILDASLLNTQHYKVRIKDKRSNPERRVAFSLTPRCISFGIWCFRVTHEYSQPSYTLLFYSLRFSYSNVSWWSFTEVWVTASLLKSPELFWVSWPILTMMYSGRF